jgi:hypothetical protein
MSESKIRIGILGRRRSSFRGPDFTQSNFHFSSAAVPKVIVVERMGNSP